MKPNNQTNYLISIFIVITLLLFSKAVLALPFNVQVEARYGKVETALWGPVSGACLQTGIAPNLSAHTDGNGDYRLMYTIPPCPYIDIWYQSNILITLYYHHFNPRMDNVNGKFFKLFPFPSFCSGYSAFNSMFNNLQVGPILEDQAQQTVYKLDFTIDVAFMTGLGVMENTERAGISIKSDLIGEIERADDTTYSEGVSFPKAQLLVDRGLLKTINEEDLANTDLLAFKESDGTLFAKTKMSTIKNIVSEEESKLDYAIPVRLPNYITYKLNETKYKDDYTPVDFTKDDKVRVVLINRVTGYMGTAIADVINEKVEHTDVELVSFEIPQITMRPPNLKIEAIREMEIKDGFFTDDGTLIRDGKERQNIIGYEGSGLVQDKYIKILTSWLDENDNPLPEGLSENGFTGRLAIIVDDQYTLRSGVNNRIAEFSIKPGNQTQVVKLPQEDLSKVHYYLHVCGEPTSGTPNFSTLITAEETIFKHRPKYFVPILVPVYDEATGEYKYVYRPEMQFSLFDLKIQGDKEKEMYSDDNNLELEAGIPTLQSEGMWTRFFYTLLQPELPMLETFGEVRELIFMLGDADDPNKTEFEVKFALENTKLDVSDPNIVSQLDENDFVVLRLCQASDKGNALWEYARIDIDLRLEPELEVKCRVLPGQDGKLIATTKPKGRKIKWTLQEDSYIHEIPEHRIHVKMIEIKDSECKIRAFNDNGPGWIVVRAADSEYPEVFTETAIRVGCASCEECKKPGAGFVKLKSINIEWGLGTTGNGILAGNIFLRSDKLSPYIATPGALYFSTLADDVVPIYERGKILRQVFAPQTFADIVTIDEYCYKIDFYKPEDVTDKIDGLYEVEPTAQPFVTWKIENPDASTEIYNRLKVSETRDGDTKLYEYTWNELTNDWSLNKGAGKQIIEKSEIVNTDTRIVTETIKDASNNIASVVKNTFYTYPWGESIIESVQDPDGEVLTTTTTYYEDPSDTGNYSEIEKVTNPDGSWTRYVYDETGRKISRVQSWLDRTSDSSTAFVRATFYSYNAVDSQDEGLTEYSYDPRVVTEYIEGNVTSKTYYAYLVDDTEGDEIEITERCQDPTAAYGDSGNLRTVRTRYPILKDAITSGRIKSIEYPDGRIDTYGYEYGTWNGATFSPGDGTDARDIITHGTKADPSGIANKTTREISIINGLGQNIRQETYVYTGSGYELINWTENTYDFLGHLAHTNRSDGTQSTNSWGCCNKDAETDERGIERTYTYDALKRTETATKEGAGTQEDIITTYTYDAAGRRLTQTESSVGFSQASITTYDNTGRVKTITDAAGLITTYNYSSDNRTTTVTRPGGATEITQRFIDGRIKSIKGTGVIPRYYTYGVNADGSTWTEVHTGSETSSMWEKTTTDILGRTIKTEKPGYTGTEITENFYNDKGQLIKTTAIGQADTLYVYDDLGNQIKTGLDIDNNSLLEENSDDRINESETRFAFIDPAWYQETTQNVYAASLNDTATTTGTQRTKLTGLGAAGLINESISIDVNGNPTVLKTTIDRTTKTETRLTDYPDSTIDATSVSINGLLASTTFKSGITLSYGYDNLGRRISVTDPRTGTSETHYNEKGQVDYVEDAADNRTSFTYDPDSGEKLTETNALSKVTRYQYNDRSQVTNTWGNATYPTEYVYDAYGRMSEMNTYRTGSGFTGDTWPTGNDPDTTRWHYQESTGLLTSKEDDLGKSTTYTYTTGGKLETRTWARLDGSDPIITAYNYDPNTGELLGIDYSDTTQDIDFTYDRLGRQKTITDTLGTRTFAYNNSLQLESEAIIGLYTQTITRTFETTGVVGRPTGFNTGSYSVTYGYEANAGRFNSINWDIQSTTDTATYGYLSNSELIETVSMTSGHQATYAYETNRNLRTQVKNSFDVQNISQYDYTYNELGLRSSVLNSGQAFGSSAFNRFGYDDRNQLTSSDRYQGTDITDTSTPVDPEKRIYSYDPIGNRTNLQEGLLTGGYTTNELNQYTVENTPQGATNNLVCDDDGNLTQITGNKNVSFFYNAENRLKEVLPLTPQEGDNKSEFAYDYMGRRVSKKVSTYTSGAWTEEYTRLFVYDGWNLIQELDDTGAVLKSYVNGLDLSQSLQGAGGIGGIIAVIDGADTYNYCYDANGNVGQLISSADGGIVAKYEYDPYGKVITSDGSYVADNSFRFSSKYYDSETDLYYYGYRYYSATLGRWISRDPIEEDGGINLYAFVQNSSINNIDPFGMSSYGTGGISFGYIDPLQWISEGFADWFNFEFGGKVHRINGHIDPFLDNLLNAAAGGNVGYTWNSPSIPFGPGGIASLRFKATVSGQMVDCYDTITETIREKGMFDGIFTVSANVGVGYLDDSKVGCGFDLTSSDKCTPCKTTIKEMEFDLSAVAGAGTGDIGWSVMWSKPIGKCSASKGCSWTFATEKSSLQVGAGAKGARISVVGSGKSEGTVSIYDTNW